MADFVEFAFQGAALGARYALVALGFVVIYRATGVINFAQGGFVLLGAYLTYNFNVTWDLPFAAAAIMAVVGTALVGSLVEVVMLRRMVGQPVFAVIMITIGLLFMIEAIVPSVWGFQSLDLGDPWGIGGFSAGELVVSQRDVWTLVLAALVLAGFFTFFRYSTMGLAMRATAVDPEAALAQGISARRVYSVSWAIAGGVGAIAGISLASGAAALQPGISFVALAAFPAIILGGLDSPGGAVAGGLLIGITQQLTAAYQPEHLPWLGTGFNQVMPYFVMVLLLLVRPYGLFGTKEVHRA